MRKTLRVLSALLALAMMLGMAGCDSFNPIKTIKPIQQPDTEKPSEPSEMVFTYENKTLDGELLKNGIYPMIFTEDGFYGQVYELMDPVPAATLETSADKGDANEPAEETEPADDAADDKTEAEETEPEEAVKEEKIVAEGEYGIHLYYVGFDGTIRPLSAYEELPVPEAPEDKLEYYSGSTLTGLMLDKDGGLLAVKTIYEGWFDGTEQELMMDTPDTWEKYKSSQRFFLCPLNEDGSEKSRVELDFHSTETWLNFSSCIFGEDGTLLVSGGDGIYGFAMDGSQVLQIPCDEISPERLLRLRDGSLTVAGYSEKGMSLYPVDLEKKTVGSPLQIPDDAYEPIPGDADYDIYYVNGMYLYGYRFEDGQKDKVLNWMDVDIIPGNLNGWQIREDGTLMCVTASYRSDRVKTELVRVYQVPADSIPQKETLTLGVLYAYDLYEKVVDFNRHSDKVRITIKDYSEYNDYENDDFDAGRTKLLTEILSGEVPDLLAVSQLPYRRLAAKGLLEDLYPYLDADKELSREDFFPNVLSALEVDGGLYQVTMGFNVQTLIGPASVVGDEPGWNYQEMMDALAKMPEGCELLDMYTTRGDLLHTLLCTDLKHYVDWGSGQCSFDSQDFLDLLEFTAQFPAEIPDDLEWESSADRLADGRQLLTATYLYSVDSMLWDDLQFGDMGCTYIGYPTNEGVGSFMYLNSGYAMSSSCRNKEAAWEFLRSFLTYEAQSNSWDGIPLSMKVYQEKLEKAMTPEYEKNEKGEYVLDENGERIQIAIGGFWMENGKEVQVYCMTQEQADKLWSAISTCDKIWEDDDAIYSIVNEMAQAYYSGQKSAEDVARLIQNKALIYVNEQR